MADSAHPLARDPQALRLLEHSLLQIEGLLQADSFSLDGDQVTFRRRASAGGPAMSWQGRLGDWLVQDGSAHWRIVSDDPLVVAPAVTERT